jgi:hypothetical protein
VATGDRTTRTHHTSRFLVIDAKGGDLRGDTTAVELRTVELGGEKRIWNLDEDVVESTHAGNPHADRFGNADVWRFYAVPVVRRPTTPSS